MHPDVQACLNEQGNHELLAALSYEAMAYWCAANDYDGFAGFFRKQAEEEREHAEKFFNHLLDRGVQPEIGAVEKPRNSFEHLGEVATLAQHLEKLNTTKIKACYEAALAVKDYESQPLLMWFINEQVEEEAWAGKMVSLVARAECAGSVFQLDRHITKLLEERD